MSNVRHLIRDVDVNGDPSAVRHATVPILKVVADDSTINRPLGLLVTAERSWCSALATTGLVVLTSDPAHGLELLTKPSFRHLFVDKGSVGDTNGFRFAQTVRQTLGDGLNIWILCDTVTPSDQEYASRNGANNVLERDADKVLSVVKPTAQSAAVNALSRIDAAWRQRLSSQMRKLMGTGGVVSLDKELIRLASRSSTALTSSEMMACACQIFGDRRKLREEFIASVKADHARAAGGKK